MIRSRRYHPDRSSASAEIFIHIRQAYEGLSDPVKRFAYDRFGPGAIEWKAASYREYMRRGIMQSAGFYGFSALFMLGLPREASDRHFFQRGVYLRFSDEGTELAADG